MSSFRSVARKARNLAPTLPVRRYNVFGGTTHIRDWSMALRLLFARNVTTGDVIRRYEERFAEMTGTRYAISFAAGRMALFAILEALNIGEGDEVVIPAFTCVVVPNAILYRGAKPVYADIDARTFNIDVAKVEARITPRTRALYAQHTFGLPCDIDAIKRLAARHNLLVIEDGALALGTKVHGAPVGSLGTAALFSTDHSKTINTLLGGMAVTNDTEVARRLRTVQEQSDFLDDRTVRQILLTFVLEYVLFAPSILWIGRSIHLVLGKVGLLFYFRDELQTRRPSAYPYPARLSASQAELGLRQLNDFAENARHRRLIAEYLERRIGWIGGGGSLLRDAVPLRYSFLVRDRRAVEARLRTRFDLGVWFTSIAQGRDRDLDEVGYVDGSCPVAEHVVEHIVNFPTHSRIPLSALERSVERNLEWINQQVIRERPVQ